MGMNSENGSPPPDLDVEQRTPPTSLRANVPSQNKQQRKSVKKTALKGQKKTPTSSGKYALRSSNSSVRLLRSQSKPEKKDALPAPAAALTPTNGDSGVEKKRRKKKKKRAESKVDDVYARTKLQVAYYLRRMDKEQNLVDVYAAEGWRGQSLEKIRPEKELERAKSEITRCKLKIRDLFKQLDSFLLEGKLEESLFDPDGQIDSEDIFCAKCGSKELYTGNDIILCDGVCDRGFHQKCLSPPLLNEDIPSDDEGWLCPGCDCKVECIDLVNEFQGTDLSVENEWEKIFPEAAATADKMNPYDDLGLPSDDSEDEDFAPDDVKVDDKQRSDSSTSSGESDSCGDFDLTSEGSDVPNNDFRNDDLGLPSDDSEDDDYDPDDPDINKTSKEGASGSDVDGSSSDDSDFSSASEGSGALDYLNEFGSECPETTTQPVRASHDSEIPSVTSELLHQQESDLGNNLSITSIGKRKRKVMSNNILQNELRHKVTNKDSLRKKRVLKKGKCKDDTPQEDSNSSGRKNNKRSGSEKSKQEKLMYAIASPSMGNCTGLLGIESGSGSRGRSLGKEVSQKLTEAFKEDQYPTTEKKMSLAQQLGIPYKKVAKWFGNARHSFRAAASKSLDSPTVTGSQNHTKSRGVKTLRTTSVEDSLDSKLQDEMGSQNSPGAAARKDIVNVGVSPQSTGEESKGASVNRKNLVLRELRKIKRIQ